MSDTIDQIREKDKVVLRLIAQGQDDVQKITAETTLQNHHVSYSFDKMEKLGLIQVSKPDQMIERVVNGQKRVFQHPKQAELTSEGSKIVEGLDQDETGSGYEDMSHSELVETVRELEEEVEDVKQSFRLFKKQIQQKL